MMGHLISECRDTYSRVAEETRNFTRGWTLPAGADPRTYSQLSVVDRAYRYIDKLNVKTTDLEGMRVRIISNSKGLGTLI